MASEAQKINQFHLAGDQVDFEEVSQFAETYADSILNIIGPGTELYLTTRVGSGEALNGEINLGIGGERKLIELGTMGEMMDALAANVDLKVSKQIITEEMAPMLLGTPMQMGLVKDDGAEWTMLGKMNNGKLIVNGQPSGLLNGILPPEARSTPMDWSSIREGMIMGIQMQMQMTDRDE